LSTLERNGLGQIKNADRHSHNVMLVKVANEDTGRLSVPMIVERHNLG